ncbi:MAG: hypothetical protein J2P16_04465 [Mycobacterium sp.]|nr:hypothetical protein [Mycobacterium sp.]
MQRFLLVAVAVSIGCVGLTGCASAAHHTSAPRSEVSRARGGDGRLVGTWQISEALDGSRTIHADAGTYEYLVFKANGGMTRYEGDSTELWAWGAKDGQLALQPADDGPSSGYTEVDEISTEFDKLETSQRIAYQVNDRVLMLSGTFPDYRDVLLHPSDAPTTPTQTTPVRISYIRVDGVPPRRTGQRPSGPSPSATGPARP